MRLWQTVTVAFAPSSRRATGSPTRFERPTITASAPSSSTPSWRSSSITPRGVQGTRPGLPWASRPALAGVSPSTSLAGSIAATTASGSICSGSGSWTRMPSTSSSSLSAATSSSSSSCSTRRRARGGPSACRPPRRPRACGDVDLRGRVVADQHGRQPRRRPAPAAPRRPRPRPALADPGRHRLAVDHARRPTSYRFLIGA